jgi:predicted acylesterase/phospholipase RssA
MASAERRLAISIKGGVSLGAYEAGALFETLRLIQHNNSLPIDKSAKWYIDVLSGASAGSITSAMVGLALIDQNSNYLYNIWVQQLSFATLLPPANSANPADNYYLLDAARLDALANQYFSFPSRVDRHPALRGENAELRLRFTLSRVNPDVRIVQTVDSAPLTIDEYAQNASFIVKIDQTNKLSLQACGIAAANYTGPNGTVIGADAWTALQQAAIASGSFPLAFTPRGLRVWDSERRWLDVTFIDGGLFDNDPVGQAINLAHDIDWSPGNNFDDNDRRYLIIHTAPSTSPVLLPNVPDSYALLVNLIGSFLTESTTTSGLRGILIVDKEFARRSAFLETLARQAAIGPVSVLPPGLLSELAEWRGIAVPEQLNFLMSVLIPDLAQTDPELFAIVNAFSAENKANFSALALAMDLALDLADKVKIDPILIAPKAPPGAAPGVAILAGEQLYGFGGFLVADFRNRDFEQGRFDAWQTWSGIARDPNEFTMPPAGDPRYPPPIVPEPASQVIAANEALYNQGRQAFFDRLDAVANSIARGATSGDLLGPVEQQIARVIIDVLARRVLN